MVTRDIATGLNAQTTSLNRLLRVGKEKLQSSSTGTKILIAAVVTGSVYGISSHSLTHAAIVFGLGYVAGQSYDRWAPTIKMFKKNNEIDNDIY